MPDHKNSTIGQYLATRLEQIGLKHYFAVPGDYNLVLLDELLSNKNLEMISCCNELNAGYAADGYARATGGPAAVCVTYSVGGLSLCNAIAGAYAEDLPVIAISGGPNTNSAAEYELLHHTLGKIDYDYMREIFGRVTVESVQITNPLDAPTQIDHAIKRALEKSKPVYLEVASNIAGSPISGPQKRTFVRGCNCDVESLDAAVDRAAELLNEAAKPVLVAGVQLRPSLAEEAFHKLAHRAGYAVAAMPNAKGFFGEDHPSYMGIYWGSVGSPGCGQIVASADIGLYAGTTFTDYSTVGHSALINPDKMILARPESVVMPGRTYNDVDLREFLTALAPKLRANDTSIAAYRRIAEEKPPPRRAEPSDKLTTRTLFDRVQGMLDSKSSVIAETGDSWFNGMQLDLPSDARFEIQMQYGSIGWSVGATLGYALGSPERRVIALIGDGSFQMTAQEVSTMIRYGVRPIIFLINNGGYTIEVEIHDGPYNVIKNWDYAGLMSVFNAGDGKGLGLKAATVGELGEAILTATDHDGPVLIEVAIHRDDCSKNLLEWGGYVAKNNSRPPRTV
ncbi:MAG: thiamine pyrophosphate-binding protein [Pseudomonadota bacterium]